MRTGINDSANYVYLKEWKIIDHDVGLFILGVVMVVVMVVVVVEWSGGSGGGW